MSWLIPAVVIILIAAIFLVSWSKKTKVTSPDYPYQVADALPSPAERSFYGILSRADEKNTEE